MQVTSKIDLLLESNQLRHLLLICIKYWTHVKIRGGSPCTCFTGKQARVGAHQHTERVMLTENSEQANGSHWPGLTYFFTQNGATSSTFSFLGCVSTPGNRSEHFLFDRVQSYPCIRTPTACHYALALHTSATSVSGVSSQ